MRRPRLTALLRVELAALLTFVGLLVALGVQQLHGQDQMVPLDVAALSTGPARERWMGIFFEDQKVGYSVTRSSPTQDGGTIIEGRSRFRLAAFGTIQDIITAQAALTDAQGRLQRFDFFMLTDQMRLSARGEVQGNDIVMEVDNGGDSQTLRFPMSHPPSVDLSLEEVVRREGLAVGKHFEVPFFSPATMAEGTMRYDVTGVEVLENGEEAWWVDTEFDGVKTRQLVSPTGETLREEGAMGMSMVRMTAEEAQTMPASDQAVDIIAKSAVPLHGRLREPRDTRHLVLQIQGVGPERVWNDPPLQLVTGDRVTVDVPLLAELPSRPIRPGPDAVIDPAWIDATPTIQSSHPEIRTKAEAIIAGATDRLDAATRLERWVFEHVEKVPTFGVPSGIEVLHSGRGDCNEHTALYVSLARAVGIPTRIAAGVVFSDRVGDQGAFYYHAWPEVLVDEDAPEGAARWLPVDPTFGQVPADATHVKLVEGDLERQVEILAVMGRLGFTLVEAR